jgi:hypothetical protein
VVAHLLSHGPAEFARPGRLVFVCLAELEIAAGSIWPPRRGRVDFLDHGQRQPGTPSCETPPDIPIGEERGEFPVTPPLRQPAPRACHLTQPGSETGLHGLHPGARIDEDIARIASPSIAPAAASSGPARLCPMSTVGWPAALPAITRAWRR